MRGPESYGNRECSLERAACGSTAWSSRQGLRRGEHSASALSPAQGLNECPLQQIDSTGSRFTAGQRSHNGRYAVVEFSGDSTINDLTAGTSRRITQTSNPNGRRSFDERSRDLLRPGEQKHYSIDLSTGFLKAVTTFGRGQRQPISESARVTAGDSSDSSESWFESVRDRIRADSIARANGAARFPGTQAVYMLSGGKVADFSISPAGNSLLITPDTRQRQPTTDIPQFVTEVATRKSCGSTKVGDAEQKARIALLTFRNAAVTWLKPSPPTTTTGTSSCSAGMTRATRARDLQFSGDSNDSFLRRSIPLASSRHSSRPRQRLDRRTVQRVRGLGDAGRIWYVS